MQLNWSSLAFVLCIVAKAEVKRELGFTGLGSYHGGNEGHVASDEFHDSIERQGNTPEITGGLANYATVGGGLSKNIDFNNYGSHRYQHGGNLHNNPIVTPSFHAQSNLGHHGTSFDHSWPGRGKYGTFQNGLSVGHSATLGVPAPKTVIPVREDTQHNGPLLTPLRHMDFSGLTFPATSKDYTSGTFLSSTHSGLTVPHDASFGLRLLPTRVGHRLFGHGHVGGKFDLGTSHFLGGYQGSQTNFGHNAGHFSAEQGNNGFSQSIPGHDATVFNAGGVQGQGVSHITTSHSHGASLGSTGHGQVGSAGQPGGGSSHNYDNSFGSIAHTSAENQETSSYNADHVVNDVDSHSGSHFGSEYHGNIANQHSLDINSSQQDYHNNLPANDHESGQHSTSSHEVQSDSTGSHGYGDSTQISHSTSAEQKYIPPGEQATSHIHDSEQNSQSTLSHGTVGDKSSSSLITNGHAVGRAESSEKATSFQSFVIHSYRPKRVFARKFVHKPFVPVHNPFINVPPPPVHHEQ